MKRSFPFSYRWPALALCVSLLVWVLATALPTVKPAQAEGPTLDEVKALFTGWTATTAVARGYQASPFCIDGRLMGMPEMGTMGFHYVKPNLLDIALDPVNPEAILIGPDGKTVIGVEYLVVWAKNTPIPTLFGQKFEGPMVGHDPGMPVHYDLHVWFVNNPAGQFADFNPNLPLCPSGSLPPPPTSEMVAALYKGISADAAVALGYKADPFCVDGRVAGNPALGTMGMHYANEALVSTTVNPMAPPLLLVNPHNMTVMGLEYFVPDVGQPKPSVLGQPMNGPMPGHGPGQPTHYDLHVWSIPNPAGMFADFNPALAPCPAGTLPPAAPSGAPPAGDTSLPYAIGALALVGLLALGAGVRLLQAARR